MWQSQIVLFENKNIQEDFFTTQLGTGNWTVQHVTNETSPSPFVVRQFFDETQTIICYKKGERSDEISLQFTRRAFK